jgi:cytochrome c oxidase subunit 2
MVPWVTIAIDKGRAPGKSPGMLRRPAVLVLFCLLGAGCGDNAQNTLDPASKPARSIETLWWWMLGVSSFFFLGAVGLLGFSWLQRHRRGLPLLGDSEKVGRSAVVLFGIGIPVGILIALFTVGNFAVTAQTDPRSAASTRLTIVVTGRQWFWDVRYPGTPNAVTANEIHIPAGEDVNVVTIGGDVIHSFWVPELNRKVDMIPGHPNHLTLHADHPGRYRGQCAEYCGPQHAHMAMWVDADPPARFKAWLAGIAKPARPPASADARRGEQVFMGNACASCHQIRGTQAHGRVGPDLTHLAQRSSIAALVLPNTRQALTRWVRNPQHVKPGNRMPALHLSRADLHAVVSYLDGLQ